MKLRTLTILSVLAVILLAVSFAALGEDGNVTSVAVLSTTDMHGKCWHTDLLTDAPLDPEAQRFTVRFREDGSMALVNEDGLFLTGAAGGGLSLQPEEAENGMSRWTLREAYGGWNILCTGTDMPGSTPRALEFYSGHITTYAVSSSGIYVFNFYEIPGR